MCIRDRVCIDQLVLPGEAGNDTNPPTVTLTCGDGVLTAALSDNVETVFDERMVSVSVDGVDVPFTIVNNVVTASYTLNTEGIHRVSVTVSDLFGRCV